MDPQDLFGHSDSRNYLSVELNMEKAEQLLSEYVTAGFCRPFASMGDMVAFTGGQQVV